MKYVDKLKDYRWLSKRRGILDRDCNICRDCYTVSNSNHVHHLYYEYGLEPWEYPDDALITLCADCHSVEHGRFYSWPVDIEITRGLKKSGLRVKDFGDLFPDFAGDISSIDCAEMMIREAMIFKKRRDDNYYRTVAVARRMAEVEG